MEKFIQRPLTKKQIKSIIQFLSYHFNFSPRQAVKVKFTKTPEEFAALYEGYKADPAKIHEINQIESYFFDHSTYTVVFQGFSYVDGIVVPQFLIEMSSVIHEFIHYFQHAAGNYGSWRILYEGTNELLCCFFADDYNFDYKEEAVYAFNLAMIINDNDIWEAINWLKKFTVHSDKNKFVSRSILQTPILSKFRPTNLLRWLDNNQLNKIKNPDVRALFTKYSEGQINNLLHNARQIIM